MGWKSARPKSRWSAALGACRTLARPTSETQEKIASAGRDLAAARAEIAALKATVAKLDSELAQLKAKAEPANKK